MWCFRCQNHSFMTRWRHNSKINFIFSPAQNLKKPALKMVVPSQTRQIKKGFYTGVTSFYPQFVTSYLQRKFWLYFSRSEIRIDLITRFFLPICLPYFVPVREFLAQFELHRWFQKKGRFRKVCPFCRISCKSPKLRRKYQISPNIFLNTLHAKS